jgi:hypothetical protein
MKPFEEMSIEELRSELDRYRKLWTWVEEEVKAWLCHTAYPCAITRRDYHRFIGTQGVVHFKPESVELDVTETEYNYLRGEAVKEVKTVTIPINQITNLEYIHDKEVMPIENPLEQGLKEVEDGVMD